MIERISSKEEIRAAVGAARREGKRIGFVPTMGALHEGHISLVRAACARTDVVITSVFVNPTQFGPAEDFDAYPRPLESDVSLLEAEGVELVFIPTPAAMYGSDPQVTVDPGPLASRWEGPLRPGHFSGVATIVTKLLSVIRPDLAFFGEKDFQQLRLVERLVRDLDLGVGVVGCPTVRESDGLALSSRNAYLSTEERRLALGVPEALEAAVRALAWGTRDSVTLEAAMREAFEKRTHGAQVTLDYAAVVDSHSLEPISRVESGARALIAARVGTTHLIDNCALTAPVHTENTEE
jgi:pantoate--beta-alanine ligase